MYKKAGIVIAVVLVGIAVVVGAVSSCSGNGGLRVSTGGSGGSNAENSKTTTVENKGSDGAVNGSNSDVGVSSQNEINNSFVADESTVESKATVESKEPVENKEPVISNEPIESSTPIESEEPVEESSDITNKLIEIDEKTIKYDYTDKEMNGKIKEKVVYSLNDTLVNSFKILAENGETYEYFVPQSAYDSVKIGTKVTINVRVYFDDGVSIVKVLSLTVAD